MGDAFALSKVQVPPPQPQTQDNRDPKLLKAAQMYENQFLREMVRAMRKTVNESELMPAGMGEKIYREQLDDQYVDQWVGKGGVGLADLIYNQINDRYGKQFGMKNIKPLEKPKGPLPEDLKQNMKIKKNTDVKSDQFTFYINRELDKKALDIMSPWSGTVQSSFQSPEGLSVIKLDHDNGTQSTLAFNGAVSDLSPDTKVTPGDRIGRFSAEKPLIWSINYSPVS